ncbi:MAG: Calx-beta domain-containing protein [Pirellulaceae bacterium]
MLDDDASTHIADVDPNQPTAYTGIFRPIGNLATLVGKAARGTWSLRIANESRYATARLNSWSLTLFGSAPPTPLPVISIDDITILEGDVGTANGQFTITRSGDLSRPATVEYATSDGTASEGSDYLGIVTTKLTFSPGVASLPVSVFAWGDLLSEPDETFIVTLDNPTGATIGDGQGVATILDDDAILNTNVLYVYDIRFESRQRGRSWRAVFQIQSDSDGDGQANASDEPASGVSITVTFAGQTYSGITDSNGIFRTDWNTNLGPGNYFANAVDLALTGFVWNPLDIDLEDDTDADGKPDDLLSI